MIKVAPSLCTLIELSSGRELMGAPPSNTFTRNAHRIRVYDFAYVRSNRAQNFPQVQARCDFGRQIEE
jgi:hypothetical protein